MVKRSKKDISDGSDDCIITGVSMSTPKKANPKGKRKAKAKDENDVSPTKDTKAESSTTKAKPKPRAKKSTPANTKRIASSFSKKRSSSVSTSKSAIETSLPSSRANQRSNTKKKAKKTHQGDGEFVFDCEERGGLFRKFAPKKVLERLERVNNQRMFLVDREKSSFTVTSSDSSTRDFIKEEFKVLGSTANVYTVVIDLKPRCDCPDFRNFNRDTCKHIIFVFLRVLGVSEESKTWYQRDLLPIELEEVFQNARPDPTTSNPSITRAYLEAVGKDVDEEEGLEKGEKKRKIPQQGDVCPICYEEFPEGKEGDLTFCESSCGNPLHKSCAKEWSKSCEKSGQDVTCIYCRAPMTIDGKKSKKVSRIPRRGYLNLATPSQPQVEEDSEDDFLGYDRYDFESF